MDVSTVVELVKAEITLIHMLFIIEFIYFNTYIFNEEIGYIIPDFGPLGGYLERLSSEIRGAKYYK